MIFSSYQFIFVFLPLTFALYFILCRCKLNTLAKYSLVAASFVFYAYGCLYFLPFFIGSVLFNYLIGQVLSRLHNKNAVAGRLILTAGIVTNVVFLGYYKYLDFLFENINLLFKTDIPLPHIALPIGISFFTFQLIAYIVDSYRGETKEYNFLNYLLFITFFPQLIVGPIVHHKDVVPQFEDKTLQKLNFQNLSLGLFLFSIGAVKKLFLADPLTGWSEDAFRHITSMNMLESWMHAVSYTVSYYFDLSGYADMAIGLGLMFNINLPINFNSPYKARNFADYWRRWHITLSKFLGDYIFRSIFKKGKPSYVFYFATFMTFLVSGMWHGAGWTFIVWGILNGLFVMAAHKMTRSNKSLPLWLAWSMTFLGAVFMRILFVSKNIKDAFYVFVTMFDIGKFEFIHTAINNRVQILYCLVGLGICFFAPNSNQLRDKFKPTLLYLAITVLFLAASLLTMNKVGDFLYFQF